MTIRTHPFAALLLAFFMLAATGCDSADEEPTPTTGTITGTISLPAGAGGAIVNTRVQLFETLDEFEANSPTFTTTTDADGNFSFENINPDSYFVSAWKDNNNSGDIDGGDFFGVIGTNQIEGFVPSRQQVVAGQNTGFSFTTLILPPGFGVSLSGTYVGTSAGSTFTLTLSEASGAITGSGNVNGVTSTVTGTFNAPNVSMVITPQGFIPINFTGTSSEDGSVLTGNLNGSGFENDPITFTRS